MIIDEKNQDVAAFVRNLQATAYLIGQFSACIGVVFDPFGTTGIVQEQGEVKRVGIFQFVKKLLVESEFFIPRVAQFIEFFEADDPEVLARAHAASPERVLDAARVYTQVEIE